MLYLPVRLRVIHEVSCRSDARGEPGSQEALRPNWLLGGQGWEGS